jgi:uncharacterized protein YdeI (YjbR/CyaY-like superfamily)
MAPSTRTRRAAVRRAAGTRPAARRPARTGAPAADAPRDLEQALRDDPVAQRAFVAMPPSHRKAYVEFIEEAKRPETRVRRVQQALRMMAQWGAERAKRGAKRR